MKRAFIVLLMLIGAGTTPAQQIESSVVKIYVTSVRVYTGEPWRAQSPQESSGTGFIIEGNRILTNAHVVDFATFVQVKKSGEATKHTARVAFVTHQADLALLTVDDPEFFTGTVPIQLGELPNLQDKVTVIGYPMGGEEISYSSGIVSRIEVTSYAQSKEMFLAIQVDASINPGNSGGPAILDGKAVGVAMQSLTSGQNLNYIIPTDLVQHFLDDVRDGEVDGFPSLSVFCETMENRMLREYFGLDPFGDDGLLVTAINYESDRKSVLQRDDIILSINGHKVFSNGKYELRPKMLVRTNHITSMLQVGDDIVLSIQRNGERLTVREKAVRGTQIVPYTNHSSQPPYFIFCGFVFLKHNRDYYAGWGSDPPPAIYQVHDWEARTEQRQDAVLYYGALSHDATAGYTLYGFVASVNGAPVVSFADFVEKVKASGRWVRIRFEDEHLLVIDSKKAESVNADVLETYQIPRSEQ